MLQWYLVVLVRRQILEIELWRLFDILHTNELSILSFVLRYFYVFML